MSGESTDDRPLRRVPVDWEALEDAFENNAPEVHSYLHLDSGEVLRVVDGIADPEMHSRIVGDVAYLRIESVSSREQYRWMERFIELVETPPLRALLAQAIDGKGAFRRFKDVLMSQATERERWFTFRTERLRVFMEAWLTAHAIAPAPRPAWPAERALEVAADAGKAVPRRARSADSLRRQLKEITDGLGTRDIDKVLTFAEFIKARRIARNQNRNDASNVDQPVPDSVDSMPYTDLKLGDLRNDLRSSDLRSSDLRSGDLRSGDLRVGDLKAGEFKSAEVRPADAKGSDVSSDAPSSESRKVKLLR